MCAMFVEIGLSEPITKAIAELGYEEPTPIQQQSVPVLLRGADLIGQAQTGTGKTAAFGIPLLERIRPGGEHPQGLVLVPTRELAMQDAEALHALGRYREVRVLPIYGGQPIERQLRALQRGVDVVVGTPGRIMDHIRRGTLHLERVSMVVLDEADEMLNMGFIEDIEFILEHVPAERQTALFSATIPPRITALARKYLRQPEQISVSHERITVPQIRQTYYEVFGRNKLDALSRILDAEMPSSAMIFTRTKSGAAELSDQLIGLGFEASPIHGDLSQAERDRVMRRFRDGVLEILVATDVAARGLDIPDVSHVINYDVPTDPESYVHRIGRTGRAGRTGEAITLISPRERHILKLIERTTGRKLRAGHLPTAADVAARRREALKGTVESTLKDTDLTPYLLVIEELAREHDVAEVAAALLKMTGELDIKRHGVGVQEAMQVDGAAASDVDTEPGMVKLYLNLGRQDGLRPNHVVGTIAGEAKIPGQAIGAIDIYDAYTTVQVPNVEATRIVAALQRTMFRGRRLTAELARPGKRKA